MFSQRSSTTLQARACVCSSIRITYGRWWRWSTSLLRKCTIRGRDRVRLLQLNRHGELVLVGFACMSSKCRQIVLSRIDGVGNYRPREVAGVADVPLDGVFLLRRVRLATVLYKVRMKGESV